MRSQPTLPSKRGCSTVRLEYFPSDGLVDQVQEIDADSPTVGHDKISCFSHGSSTAELMNLRAVSFGSHNGVELGILVQ